MDRDHLVHISGVLPGMCTQAQNSCHRKHETVEVKHNPSHAFRNPSKQTRRTVFGCVLFALTLNFMV